MARQSGNRGATSVLEIFFDEGGTIDRGEQPAPLEIASDYLGDAASRLGVRWAAGEEIGQRDRHRLDVAFIEFEPQGAARVALPDNAAAPMPAPSISAWRRRNFGTLEAEIGTVGS
jgi:hypothetical protein